MKIYLASSWRNPYQPSALLQLRDAGHEVYDFRHPKPDDNGFGWDQIDPNWKNWTPEEYRNALSHAVAQRGFKNDRDAMEDSDGCVLLLPCGRSAHLEAGWFMGMGRPVWIVIPEPVEPELMYLLNNCFAIEAHALCLSVTECVKRIHDYLGE